MHELDKFQQECFEWSAKTFGVCPIQGPLAHLRSELDEIEANPDDLMEWADAYILLQDAAARQGMRMSNIFATAQLKHEKNTRREWPPIGEVNEKGFTEHVK